MLALTGRGGWIRTNEYRSQSPVPYRLATPLCSGQFWSYPGPEQEERCMEPLTGIEPASPAWKAGVLPLHHIGRCRSFPAVKKQKAFCTYGVVLEPMEGLEPPT